MRRSQPGTGGRWRESVLIRQSGPARGHGVGTVPAGMLGAERRPLWLEEVSKVAADRARLPGQAQ